MTKAAQRRAKRRIALAEAYGVKSTVKALRLWSEDFAKAVHESCERVRVKPKQVNANDTPPANPR